MCNIIIYSKNRHYKCVYIKFVFQSFFFRMYELVWVPAKASSVMSVSFNICVSYIFIHAIYESLPRRRIIDVHRLVTVRSLARRARPNVNLRIFAPSQQEANLNKQNKLVQCRHGKAKDKRSHPTEHTSLPRSVLSRTVDPRTIDFQGLTIREVRSRIYLPCDMCH